MVFKSKMMILALDRCSMGDSGPNPGPSIDNKGDPP